MNKNWHGIMKLIDITHFDKMGNILYSEKNINNILHRTGEGYILTAAFLGDKAESFYFGLDSRSSLNVLDTMTTIINSGNEPTINGYSRVSVNSTGAFSLNIASSHYVATGPVISFSATGGSWGPVKNLFLTTKSDNSGILIASVQLSQTVTLNAGETLNVRLGLSLRDFDVS